MKVTIELTHKQTGTLDIGELPIDVIHNLFSKEGIQGNTEYCFSDLVMDERWELIETVVTPIDRNKS